MNLKNSNQKGFTLIELLVVVSIIGLLSSVVLASLSSARAKSRDTKRIAQIRQMQTALEFYYDKYGRYPSAVPAVSYARTTADVSYPNCGALGTWCIFESTLSEFIAAVPRDLSIESYIFYYKNNNNASVPGYGLGVNLELPHAAAQNDGGFSSTMYEVGTYPTYCMSKYTAGNTSWNSWDGGNVCVGGN